LQDLLSCRFDRLEGLICQGSTKTPQLSLFKHHSDLQNLPSAAATPATLSPEIVNEQVATQEIALKRNFQGLDTGYSCPEPAKTVLPDATVEKSSIGRSHHTLASLSLPLSHRLEATIALGSSYSPLCSSRHKLLSDHEIRHSALRVSSKLETAIKPEACLELKPEPRLQNDHQEVDNEEVPATLFAHCNKSLDWDEQHSRSTKCIMETASREQIAPNQPEVSPLNIAQVDFWTSEHEGHRAGKMESAECRDHPGIDSCVTGESSSEFLADTGWNSFVQPKEGEHVVWTMEDGNHSSFVEQVPFPNQNVHHDGCGMDGHRGRNSEAFLNVCRSGQELQGRWDDECNDVCSTNINAAPTTESNSSINSRLTACNRACIEGDDREGKADVSGAFSDLDLGGWLASSSGGDGRLDNCQSRPYNISEAALAVADRAMGQDAVAGSIVVADLAWITS
jgi:hypothetical protein